VTVDPPADAPRNSALHSYLTLVKIPKLRWIIAFLLCLSTMINYLDRQAIGVVSVEIRREFSLTEQDYSYILSFFFLAYAIMYADRVTSSIAWARAGASRSLFPDGRLLNAARLRHRQMELGSYRFLLGLSEPGRGRRGESCL